MRLSHLNQLGIFKNVAQCENVIFSLIGIREIQHKHRFQPTCIKLGTHCLVY